MMFNTNHQMQWLEQITMQKQGLLFLEQAALVLDDDDDADNAVRH